MKWQLDQHGLQLYHQYQHLIPKTFDHNFYIQWYPDLQGAGIDNEDKAKQHYLFFGRNENRIYNPIYIQDHNKTVNNYEQWHTSKNILYLAPTAPDYDQSSGGNRLLQILDILRNTLKYKVYFICNNGISKKYIDKLKSINIHTYVSDPKENYISDYLSRLQNRNINFDYVFFSWYDMAFQYLNTVKEFFPNAKIITDSVDVHWLRESRGSDKKHIRMSEVILAQKKQIEKKIYESSDVIFAVTENDKQEISKELEDTHNIKILSNIHDPYKKTNIGHNISFIGNYAHTPNVSAAKECIHIFNQFKLSKEYKSLKNKPKLLLVGPNSDKSMFGKLDKSILITGQVKNLETIYSQSKVLLAPLFWGAGIKGKICDASMRSIPILTSDVGNEGIGLRHMQNGFISNTRKQFVKVLKSIFTMSDAQLSDIRFAGRDHIHKIVSRESAISVLRHTLQAKHIVLSIVAYNKPDMVYKCIQSILDHTDYPNYTIYVSDNSENDSVKNKLKPIIKQHKDKIIYQKNSKNLFFIEPNNTIMKKFNKSDIVLVNDDIEIITDGWLSYLYSSAYSANYIAAAGGKTIFPNNTIAEAGAELYNDGTGRNIGRYNDPNDQAYNQQKYVGYCSGCLLYMRRDAIKKIGYLDTDLELMYYEDSEWQYRAHIAGLKTIYEPRCVAIHNEGSSCGTDISTGMKRYQEINRKIFLEKYKLANIEQYNHS